MKINKHVFFPLVFTILAFTAVTYTSCVKDYCAGVVCYNYGVCDHGVCQCASGYTGARCQDVLSTAITFKNNSFTPVTITVNGSTDVIPVGSTITYSGTYGNALTGSATTCGSTSNGAIIGVPVSWNINENFPATGTITELLNVSQDYFFLYVQNRSAYNIQTVYVNYGLVSQTNDNVYIPNNGITYSMGYYEAYTNSNVRLANGANYWYYNPLNLSFVSNQSITVTAN